MVIGSSHFVFEDEGCKVRPEYRERFEALPEEYSHLYLAIEKELTAVICIEDPLREEAADLGELVVLKRLANGMLKRIGKNYQQIIGINAGLIVFGIAGVLQPTTSALLHNTSTLLISLRSMRNLLTDRTE